MENVVIRSNMIQRNIEPKSKLSEKPKKSKAFDDILTKKVSQEQSKQVPKDDQKIKEDPQIKEETKVESSSQNEIKEEKVKPSSKDEIKEDIKKNEKQEIPKEVIENMMQVMNDLENMMNQSNFTELNKEIQEMFVELKGEIQEILTSLSKDPLLNLENIKSQEEKIFSLLSEMENTLISSDENMDVVKDFKNILAQMKEWMEAAEKAEPIKNTRNMIEANNEVVKTENLQKNAFTQTEEKSEIFTERKEIKNEIHSEQKESMQNQNPDKQKGGFFANFQTKVVVNEKVIQDIPTQFVMPNTENIVEQIKTQASLQKPQFDSVLNQIIEKASVIVDEKGSEMNIQLKPEHLGKLSMSISVERGVVVANIVAENQAVKEVLESNFNGLKEALQQKGLGIEQFNVSVGQDSKQNSQQGHMNFKRKNTKAMDPFIENDELKIQEMLSSINSTEKSQINQLG
ncbi:flagellar hook-length control protein FliK [Inediibacterium massiliense]|uniref:flagellar hook-length control protein FliK n=1 Tax=Inediibacterium massiliense TaxID=1658111 RepID=UPI0006B54B08|nr:flagellar hook-length control protein FliK [Inediibacterium massiliense]